MLSKLSAPALQPQMTNHLVWALPVSLAATQGIARGVFHTNEHNVRTEHDSLLFSIPLGTEMFHFPRFAPTLAGGNPFWIGFPHSETSGSMATNRLPGAFRWFIASFIALTSLGIHRVPFMLPVRNHENHNTCF